MRIKINQRKMTVKIKLESIQNDIKQTKKHTILPISTQRFMVKTAVSYSIFLLIIIILLYYLLNILTNNAQNSYTLQKKSTFISNVETFETDLNIIDAYCHQLLQDSRFKSLAVSDNMQENNFLTYGTALAADMETEVFLDTLLPISEHFCYLPESHYILAPGCFTTRENYYHQIKKYTADMQEEWNKVLTSSQYRRFLPIGDSDFNNTYYLYMVDTDSLQPHMKLHAIMCFVMEKSQLSSLFEGIDNVYVSDPISAEPNAPILSLSVNASTNIDMVTSNNPNIDTYQSKNTNFTYYYSYPNYDAISNFAHPQILYPIVFVIVLLCGIWLVVILSKNRMKPIATLNHTLQSIKQEIDMLLQEKNLLLSENKKLNQEKDNLLAENKNLIQEKSHLMQAIDNQKPILRTSYARQLLKGYIVSEKEASYARTFLGLKDEGLVYNSLYIVVYNNITEYPPTSSESRTTGEYSTFEDYSTPENRNAIVLKTLHNYMEDNFFGFCPSDRTYALIVVGDAHDEKDLIIRTNEMIVQMHNELLDTYGIWLFAGIGKNTDNIVNVWESYQQAIEAASYISKKYIFLPYEFINKDSSVFYYPSELSTKLIHFITTGNTSQVLELFNLLHQENIEERSLPLKMLQFLLSDIKNTLLKARFALPSSIPEDVLKDLDACFDQHISFKLCEDIALKLCKLFTAETNDANLISSIEKYIHENYADPSMGLNKISDEFQISESYFSHMFKEKTGVNFSTYLETIRLNEATRLIRETDTSLNELYILIGYNNANSFRRAFKKVYGITPSAMRDAK